VNDVLIDLEDITFAYKSDRPVLLGVNLELKTGERIALVGANGSGKSTLLHIITGLIHPESGEIRAFGKKQEEDMDSSLLRTSRG